MRHIPLNLSVTGHCQDTVWAFISLLSSGILPDFEKARKVVGKNVHATILKGNMGYDQYTVPDTVADQPTFVAFLQHSQTYVHGPSSNSFKFL